MSRCEPSISLVIPAYNEAESIVGVVEEICACLDPGLQYEIIVVDDGSTDDTADRLVALRSRGITSLRILRHLSNLGQSAAIRTGIKTAKCDWIVTLDGDGQNDPADIPRLLEIRTGPGPVDRPQLICGHRHNRQDPWLKRFSSRIANRVRGRLLGDGMPDTACGLKLIHRAAFLDLPFFENMHRFLPALIARDGGRVLSVPVNHRPRVRGESKYGVNNRLWIGIVDLFGVLWLKRRGTIPIFKEVS